VFIAAPRHPEGGLYIWERCTCELAAWDTSELRILQHTQRLDTLTRTFDAAPIVPWLEVDRSTFESERLKRDKHGRHPHEAATHWLRSILAYGDRCSRSDPDCPTAALYLVGPTESGKTLQAMLLAAEAHRAGRSVELIEEMAFLTRYWGTKFAELEALIIEVAVTPWLLVIDALGRYQPARTSVANAWASIIERRAAVGGWTVFTSRVMPDALLDRGTIDEQTERVIGHMIGYHGLAFEPVEA
jgi:hypothetical protein